MDVLIYDNESDIRKTSAKLKSFAQADRHKYIIVASSKMHYYIIINVIIIYFKRIYIASSATMSDLLIT